MSCHSRSTTKLLRLRYESPWLSTERNTGKDTKATHHWIDQGARTIQARLFLGPEVPTKVESSSTKKENDIGLFDEPTLGDARKLRGIYYLDPGDMEFKNIMKNARKKF